MNLQVRKICALLFFVFTVDYGLANADTAVMAQKGIIDLRNQDLFSASVPLNGDWQFFWKQLAFPGDSSKSAVLVNFPSLWSNDKIDGALLPSQGYASYKLMVLLPHKRPALALRMPDVYSAYSLFINNLLVSQNGSPGKTAQETTPFWASSIVYLPTQTDTLRVLLQVANFSHAKGGPYKQILLGDKDQIYLDRERDISSDFVLAGCLFMGGLFFLGLYIFGRNDKTILYFSLFCIFYSYRLIGTEDYALHSIFPNFNWYVTLRLEYLTLVVSTALFVRYTKSLYPDDGNAVIIKSVEWFCLLYGAIILFTPTIIFTGLINIFLGSMLFCIAYALFIYLRAARNKRAGSIFALGSTAVVLILFLVTDLHYFKVLPAMKPIVFLGYIAFFFLQSLALSHRFAHSFKLATIQAQQGLKAKSEFLSTMSHEIRTPLNAVIGMTHVLLDNEPRKDQKKDLNVLLFSASNLLGIVNNILDYNKIEEGKIIIENIPMDIVEIANNIVAGLETAAKEKRIELRADVDERIDKKIFGDPTRTSQVISNLVHNAVKFTMTGSIRLSITVSKIDNENITLLISVTDTGIGIEPDKQQMIFDRFTQADSSISRSFGGTGLGLAISKKILQMQHVDLQVSSDLGKGSTFYFTQQFKICSSDVPLNSAQLAPSDIDSLNGMCILLVEDNQFNVMVAQTILEKRGAKIDVALNGQEAIDKLDASKHKLILMDLSMPVMDGYEATSQLRRRGETLPIIALTASTLKEVESDVYAAGLTDIIMKPFNPEDLLRMIQLYL
jgi:signal transduction histidine kinase